jgi:hypothetical protein
MRRPASRRSRVVEVDRRDDARRPTTPVPVATRPDPATHPTPPPADGAVRPAHWAPPDTLGDILAIAWRPGAAPPREIRVRSEVRDRVLAQLPPAERARAVVGGPVGVPLVLDDELPAYPGFEVVRARPDGLLAA